MAKKRPLRLNWDGLTVQDVQEIVEHFRECERYYAKDVAKCRKLGITSIFAAALERVKQRQVFWTEMLGCVDRGEKIALRVREYGRYAV